MPLAQNAALTGSNFSVSPLLRLPPHPPLLRRMALDCLAGCEKIEIREKANLFEAVTAALGCEIEMANKYEVFKDGCSIRSFPSVEQSDCCKRQQKQCCGDCAPWDVDILYTEGGGADKAFTMNRGFTWTCCCFNRPTVEIKDVASDEVIGSLVDPFACFDLTFKMRDAAGEDVVKANGGCCQWGLCCPLPCGPCAEVNFPLSDPKSGNNVGLIQKKVPGCCKFCFASDVDNYKIDFKDVADPKHKALVMAMAIFIDFRYFNDNKSDDAAPAAAAEGDCGLRPGNTEQSAATSRLVVQSQAVVLSTIVASTQLVLQMFFFVGVRVTRPI